MDYKTTLNLPRTAFPMKANLPEREPEILHLWEEMGLYRKIRNQKATKPRWILHDGPPYANGHIHIGHALNKILKDIVVKSKSMFGYDAIFVPGWDCHGLPIEHQVDKLLGKNRLDMHPLEKRRLCRDYAMKFVHIQKEEFKRLGVFGDWENPYLTMSPDYQATIVREFGKFVGRGIVYKGLKPVHWCISCQTALAEAEVEYADHESPSVYVKFPLKTYPERLKGILMGKRPSVVIWTTTPWTLPANMAIALHPQHDYVAVEVGPEVFIVAKDLLTETMQKGRIENYRVLDTFPGSLMEGHSCSHPFIKRGSLLLLADYVTLDQGTGCVHTAPGHGTEDYETGIKYGLPIYNPVDNQGRFIPEVEHFGGMEVFQANKAIVEKMRQDGTLMAEEGIVHSYPHCWRCKNPTIFRATEQWFISMDKDGLRSQALENIRKVKWVPPWGEERIYNMIANRPDWCISRQRNWGIPITAFYCSSCKHLLLDQQIIEYVADLVAREGADVWYERAAQDLLPRETLCPQCGSREFTKEMDILDVWFDSGCSQAAVLAVREDQTWPAEMYLEGSDQHRGWFHSSLLAAVGTRGKVPYRSVLTHGFVVDGEGKKMSKSLGNVIAPQDVIQRSGAEVLRLWVASEDYREDIRLSEEILKRLADGYRKVRNTCRYLLGNLYDFDPVKDSLPYENLLEIDRFILHRLQKLIQKVRRAYAEYEFHVLYHSLHNFCAVDLSAFYLDVLKDRVYTFRAESRERRAAQTAMYQVLHALVRLMAPVLSFTAEEVWQAMPKHQGEMESVHLTEFPEVREAYLDEALAERWDRLLKVRDQVLKPLEISRQDKMIGNSLEARVELYVPSPQYEFLKDYEKELPTIFIVSDVALFKEELPSGMEGIRVEVSRAPGSKCERCWNWTTRIGENPDHPLICHRCLAVLTG